MPISKAPWERRDRAVYDANDRLVAMCFGGSADEAEDDAQLISVAPEMLGALEGAKWRMYVSDLERSKEYQDVVNAIKKARGEK